MCGIIGAVAHRNIVPILVDGLRMLEYRGYDSAGLAVLNPHLTRVRSVGRVVELELQSRGTTGETGIAHTRWATHGVPAERNAHPHASGHVAVVHNGIIENHDAIRAKLKSSGYEFHSETDTEVIAHLVNSLMANGAGLYDAVTTAVRQLEGAYAIAVISDREPHTVIGARKGAPLLVGLGNGENFFASDASALISVTNRVVYLDDGDVAQIKCDSLSIRDKTGTTVERAVHISSLSKDAVELGNYQHYMQKEIFEQPGALANTLEMVLSAQSIVPQLFGAEAERILNDIDGVLILACGTSYHSGVVARYWLEGVAGIRCNVEIASEYRYRQSVPNPKDLVLTISQSGETADTLAALQHAMSIGHQHSMTICNVPESSLMRASHLRFLMRAGPEIGVASTKAFTTQLSVLMLLTLVMAKLRGRLSAERERELLTALRHLPAAVQRVLAVEPAIKRWATHFANKDHALFLGRGVHFPIAMEGALKLKEISYIHAEAYAAGELKHGPLALVDSNMPVVAIAPNDQLLEKLKSNLQEVSARGGQLYVIADHGTHLKESDGVHVIELADHAGLFSPLLHTVPLQLLAYHTALLKGTDVDKPRNLAKSVTVE